jgi:hypothetical protein
MSFWLKPKTQYTWGALLRFKSASRLSARYRGVFTWVNADCGRGWLGHSSSETAEIHTHVTSKYLQQIRSLFDDVFERIIYMAVVRRTDVMGKRIRSTALL